MLKGHSAESRLIQLVGAATDDRMPPDGKPLSAEQVGLFGRGSTRGRSGRAEGEHWSLRAASGPVSPRGPSPHTPIDAFVRAKLSGEGAGAGAARPTAGRSSAASPSTCSACRRRPRRSRLSSPTRRPTPTSAWSIGCWRRPATASGWPGTGWTSSTSPRPTATTRTASASTPGPIATTSSARFNDDKPYARFVEEQVAGDVLFPDDPEAIVALGFLAAGPWDESSQSNIRDDTVDKKIAQNLDRDDMVTTVSTAFASTTVQCARCHDHKFDPITQEEYYGLQAVFAGVERADRPYDPDPAVGRRPAASCASGKADIVAGRFDSTAERAAVEAWEKDAADARCRAGTPLDRRPPRRRRRGASRKPDRLGPLRRAAARTRTPTRSRPRPTGRDHRRPPGSPDRRTLPHQGPGPAGQRQPPPLRGAGPRRRRTDGRSPIASAAADFDQDGLDGAQAIDGNPATAWGIHPEVGKPHQVVFELKEPIAGRARRLTVVLEQTHGRGHLIGRLRLSVDHGRPPDPATASPLPADVLRDRRCPERTSGPTPSGRTLARHVLASHDRRRELAALPAPSRSTPRPATSTPVGSFKPPQGPAAGPHAEARRRQQAGRRRRRPAPCRACRA